MMKPRLRAFGEDGLLFSWENTISEEIQRSVMAYTTFLNENYSDKILETVPSYQSLALFLKEGVDAIAFAKELKQLNDIPVARKSKKNYTWFIPVCYAPEFGLDLTAFALTKDLSIEEVIELHTSNSYLIHFIGFLPGFLYLGGLKTELHLSRKITPRLSVPKGAVAIGGEQTGIYPQESPGGWHILGKTPIDLFDAGTSPPSIFSPGDGVQFFEITKDQYDEVLTEVKNKRYQLRKEVSND